MVNGWGGIRWWFKWWWVDGGGWLFAGVVYIWGVEWRGMAMNTI